MIVITNGSSEVASYAKRLGAGISGSPDVERHLCHTMLRSAAQDTSKIHADRGKPLLPCPILRKISRPIVPCVLGVGISRMRYLLAYA